MIYLPFFIINPVSILRLYLSNVVRLYPEKIYSPSVGSCFQIVYPETVSSTVLTTFVKLEELFLKYSLTAEMFENSALLKMKSKL